MDSDFTPQIGWFIDHVHVTYFIIIIIIILRAKNAQVGHLEALTDFNMQIDSQTWVYG